MPDRCCIPACRAISNKKRGKISVFRIPKNDALRKSWLENMPPLEGGKPGQRAVVCEKHFDPSCICKRESYVDKTGTRKMFPRVRPVLLAGSLPTIFDDKSAQQPTVVKKRRRRRKLLEKRRKRGKNGKEQRDSMPLQQRLNTIASNNLPQREDNKPPPLKSQPLSPTKLKVTRQSSSKSVPEAALPPDNSSNDEVCLRWNSHHSNMQSAFSSLLSKEQYCDVTLVAEGKSLKCHKLILSSCSSYFDQVLENIMPYHHPVILIKDIPFGILKSLCDFMYAGEVNILQGDLNQLLEVAESLKIKGLAQKMTTNIPDHLSSPTESKETKEPHHQQQKTKDTSSSRFVKIAPKLSGVGVQKFDLPKGGANGDVTDPLDLMEPIYEEEATVDMPPQLAQKKIETARRSLGKRVRKRKHIGDEDHESSPPVFRSRKGTRSRPNVKVPRYFNASFDNSNEKPSSFETSEHHHDGGIDPCAEPLLELLEEIKTEPVDIEDSLIEESYDAVRSTSTRLMESVVTKQEKEDDPDPLNVEAGDDSQHRLPEGDATEPSDLVENSELCNRMENPESSYNADNSETSNLMENLVSNDLVKNSQSGDLEDPKSLLANETTSSVQVPLEYSTTENTANTEENSQGTLSTTEELPESDQT
ncbi:hypothetical protein WA026_002716 [Henosepilachna vigintioctopunctata]|uniref:BTB domain-containing protein n=1 Tax=Henosepilachna vigintioctopunctata TaxID=420089 RepID=A0AAW1U350_9CUCU